MQILGIIIGIVFFSLVWFLITFIGISYFWKKLDKYETKKSIQGISKTIFINFGWSNLSAPVKVINDGKGIQLNPTLLGLKPFRPVYIPWKEIKTIKDQYLLSKFVELSIGNPVKARLNIKANKFREIKNVA